MAPFLSLRSGHPDFLSKELKSFLNVVVVLALFFGVCVLGALFFNARILTFTEAFPKYYRQAPPEIGKTLTVNLELPPDFWSSIN